MSEFAAGDRVSSGFAAVAARLHERIAHWSPTRLERNADVLAALIQQLADLAADAEGHPRRPVPFAGAAAIPDQLAVMTADLLAAGPDDTMLDAATNAVRTTSQTLN